jgi:hypothetical protein
LSHNDLEKPNLLDRTVPLGGADLLSGPLFSPPLDTMIVAGDIPNAFRRFSNVEQ